MCDQFLIRQRSHVSKLQICFVSRIVSLDMILVVKELGWTGDGQILRSNRRVTKILFLLHRALDTGRDVGIEGWYG